MKKGRGRKSSSNKAILISLIIFVCLFIIGVPLAIVTFSLNTLPTSSVNIAVIPIEGIITGNGDSGLGQQGVSSQQIIEFIQQANGDYTIDGIILEINSPGGSPVQSHLIYKFIRAQAKKNNIKVIVFAEDLLNASITNKSSIKLSLAGLDVD